MILATSASFIPLNEYTTQSVGASSHRLPFESAMTSVVNWADSCSTFQLSISLLLKARIRSLVKSCREVLGTGWVGIDGEDLKCEVVCVD